MSRDYFGFLLTTSGMELLLRHYVPYHNDTLSHCERSEAISSFTHGQLTDLYRSRHRRVDRVVPTK